MNGALATIIPFMGTPEQRNNRIEAIVYFLLILHANQLIGVVG